MKKILARIFSGAILGAIVLLLSGCGLRQTDTAYKMNLEIWGIFDDSEALRQVIGQYKNLNPNVGNVTYRKLAVDTYRQDLLDALAAGNGPDIFLIRNSWTPAFADKIVMAPDTLIDERSYRNAFVDTVGDDFVTDEGKITGVALSSDSLALYYNKDLLGAAGITAPPATWDQFQDDVRLLTRINSFGEITQSGAALGTAGNINRSTDVLSALLLQNGVLVPRGNGRDLRLNAAAGVNALTFYTQFANPTSSLYTWNPRMHYSIDAFYEGTAAMMINYSWHYDTIKRKNSKLNFAVAPLPQSTGAQPFNFPNYWGFVVAKNKTAPAGTKDLALFDKIRTFESWQFLKYAAFPPTGTVHLQNAITGNAKDFTSTFDPAATYLEKTGAPAARRDLVEKQKTDPILGPFADGNLITRNWKQSDPESIEKILADMITSINLGEATINQSLSTAESRIGQVERK
ncbi:MAG: extracellular solute-binding protein [Candidatus Moraniibacteriota bacterium]|nr:MAG: extracellular solute-binding protein [Candidatus Moranbacteria bacterium]